MRVTIVVDDNLVIVDGEPHRVNCYELIAEDIHAVQWYHNKGEVEHRTYEKHRQPNEDIDSFKKFEKFVDGWVESKAKSEKEAKESREAMEAEAKRILGRPV